MDEEIVRIKALRDRLAKGLQEIEETYINGDMEHRVPHNLNVSFNYVEGESLIMAVKDLAVSSVRPVLRPAWNRPTCCAPWAAAMNWHTARSVSPSAASPPKPTSTSRRSDEVKVGKLRELSPLWDMFKEGIDINSIQWAAH
jgi:cysteine desulfurase